MKTKRIEIGGRAYTLAPLSLGQVEYLIDADIPDQEKAWLPISHSLLNAGQPVALEDLKQFLDLSDFTALYDAVLELNELKNQSSSEDAKADDPLDFSYLRARLAASCGWPPLLADQQPFIEILRLFEIWASEAPPLERSFAAFVGFKSKPIRRRQNGDSSKDDLINFTGQWGGQVHQGSDNLPTWMQASLHGDGLLNFKPASLDRGCESPVQ